MKPPALATWLLNRFITGHRRESLLGDLVEQYQHGRSQSWYWKQVIVAVVIATIQEVRNHRLLVIRATSVGIAVVWWLGWAFPTVWVGKSVWNWTVENNFDTARMVLFRQSGLILTVFIPTFFWTVGGWVVARTHRPRGMAMVFAFLAFFHLTYLGQLSRLYVLPVSAALSTYRPQLKGMFVIDGSLLLLTMVFAVVGGLIGAGDVEDSPREDLVK
jgi:hypothetical protein